MENKEISLAPVALTIVEKNDEDDENNDEASSKGISTTAVFSLFALSLVN